MGDAIRAGLTAYHPSVLLLTFALLVLAIYALARAFETPPAASMHMVGGPWDGVELPLERGWPLPDVVMHTGLVSGGYRRVEDTNTYEYWGCL